MSPSRTPADEYVLVGRTRVRVRIEGNGPPLLLLMGIGGQLDMWAPLARHLPDQRLVMFDFPGTGGSSAPRFAPTMAHCARFVKDLMGVLRIPSADVLGWSWGGLLAQQLAAHHPDAVRRLILACTGPGVLCIPSSPRVAARIATPRRYHSAGYLESIAADTYGGRFRHDPGLAFAEGARRATRPPSLKGYGLQLLAAATFSALLTRRVRQSTLILAGDDDPIVPTPNQRVLRALIPRSRVEVFPGAGHLVLVDSPEIAAPVISGFLTREAAS